MITLKDGTQYDPGTDSTAFDLLTPEKQAIRNNKPTPTSGTDLISSSTDYRAGIETLGTDITTLANNFGIEKPKDTDFDTTLGEMTADIEARREKIEERKDEDITKIGSDFDIVKEELSMKQQEALDAAEGRTRIGGFLTQLEVKDILNMRRQHRLEISALEGKKQELIQAAQRAYEDDDYKLARDLVQESKDLRTRIQNEKKDFMNSVLNMSQESRTATKFIRDEAQGKIDTMIKGIENGTIDPNTIDAATRAKLIKDAGYDFDIFAVTKKLADQGKVISHYTDEKSGKVYVTLQKPDGSYKQIQVGSVTPSTTGTETENTREIAKRKASDFSKIQTAFATPQTAGGERGTDGKIDPARYRAVMESMAERYGITPMDFMEEFPPERYLSKDELTKYQDLRSSFTPKPKATTFGNNYGLTE